MNGVGFEILARTPVPHLPPLHPHEGKALIRLRRCAGECGPSLSAYAQRHAFGMARPI